MGNIANRINEVGISNEGYKMKIIEYNKAIDIIVEFQDEYKAKVHTNYNSFKKGKVKNPYHPIIYNVGFYGQGKYKSRDENGNKTSAYKCWYRMLRRCYDPYELNKYPTYIDCYVCEEWLCFQNFAKWFYKNYYEINNEKMCLDKDILIKGNKIYSPEVCCFVPEKINILFIKSNSMRGKYPIGVIYHNRDNVLEAWCCNKECKRQYLGRFPLNRPFQAFTTYKNFKENYIKQVADEYKDLIPQKLYEAMYNYEVEIND